MRNTFTKERFQSLVDLNEGDNDMGFVFMSHEDEMFNPCFEIGFNFYSKIKNKSDCNRRGVQYSHSGINKIFNDDNFSQLKQHGKVRRIT